MYSEDDDDDFEGNEGHNKLFLRLKILFAGYEPSQDPYESTVDFMVDHVLFKAYKYVIELRQLLNGYTALKKEQETSFKLKKLLEKIHREYRDNPYGVEMSKIEINALSGQVKVISPYRNKISHAEHGVFNNLEYFMDVANGIRKVHLKKANELLPKVFNNLINRSNIKELLNQDLR